MQIDIIQTPFQRLINGKTDSSKLRTAIAISNSIHSLINLNITFKNGEEPRFVKNENRIYLPNNHLNVPIFNHLKDAFGEALYLKLIAYHEFGHAVQVSCLTNNQDVDIKGNSKLSYLMAALFQIKFIILIKSCLDKDLPTVMQAYAFIKKRAIFMFLKKLQKFVTLDIKI